MLRMKKLPNIIQVTTHDSGRHLGCYGHPALHTPAIDRLAAEGVRMANCFAAAPICCASRATQLTGLYPQSHGLLDLCFPPFNWRMAPEVRHISHWLKEANYHTLLLGVQHEVARGELNRLAFDSVRMQERQPAGQVAADTARFLREEAKAKQPFYAQVGFFETHTPFDFGGATPDTESGLEIPAYLADTGISRAAMAGFQGAIRKADAAVGAILQALESSGLAEDTLFVFTTDHGIEVPRAKWHLYDPGIAIALIMRYPRGGLTGGRVCGLLLGNVDYLPSILELAGIGSSGCLQGRSFARALTQDAPEPVREAVFGMYHKTQSRCVRTNRHKLIRHFDAALRHNQLPASYELLLQQAAGEQVELYDLADDPNEFRNLAEQPAQADARSELDGMLWRWMESVDDPLLKGPMRTPSYESAMRDYACWRSGG